MRPGSQLVLRDASLAPASNFTEFVADLKKNDSVSGYHHVPPREAKFVEMPETVDSRIRGILDRRGITRLYSHQLEAFNLAASGRNVVVVTPTASGKTLCYTLPVLQKIAEDPNARALFLYPTKALTYDQLDDLMSWADALDGD